MGNKKKDSETNLSSASDNNSKSVIIKRTTNQMNEQLKNNSSCLICSTLSVLTNENCCSKHIALLNEALPTDIVCNSPKLECHYCSQSKRNHRFLSLSSSDTIQTNDCSLSSNRREKSISPYMEFRRRRTLHRQQRLNNIRTPLSSSLIMNNNNNNNLRKRSRTLSNPILLKHKQRNIHQNESIVPNQSIASDLVELDSELLSIPRIALKRVIHVKDDDEESIIDKSQIILNMSQAIKQMIAQENTLPKILLKRISLEQ